VALVLALVLDWVLGFLPRVVVAIEFPVPIDVFPKRGLPPVTNAENRNADYGARAVLKRTEQAT